MAVSGNIPINLPLQTELEIKHTKVFTRNLEAYYNPNYHIIVNQGGARSSKTCSIAQVIQFLCMTEFKNERVDIFRKTLSALRDSAMLDFFEMLEAIDFYFRENHDKTFNKYTIKSNVIKFDGIDQPQKKRGTKRKILWINEANELTYEEWTQLLLRTTGKIFIDFNPSEEFHWIYDKVLTRDDCCFIQSTYLDNPFLSPVVVKEIENLQNEDNDYWRIYGLGERGVAKEKIYTNIVEVKEFPDKIDETIYGLDFGFNHPTVLTEIKFSDMEIYISEIIFQSGLTNSQLIARMNDLKISKKADIYADCAEPARIQEISEAGYNIHEADKSVSDGIDYCKRRKLHIHQGSAKGIKQIRNYKYKVDKNGVILDEPVKFEDDFPDSMRYALYTHSKRAVYDIHWI